MRWCGACGRMDGGIRAADRRGVSRAARRGRSAIGASGTRLRQSREA
jgi:hypothetical protein